MGEVSLTTGTDNAYTVRIGYNLTNIQLAFDIANGVPGKIRTIATGTGFCRHFKKCDSRSEYNDKLSECWSASENEGAISESVR